MAGAYAKLGTRERMQALIAAGARGDLAEVEKILSSPRSAGVLSAEMAIRESFLRAAIGLLSINQCLVAVGVGADVSVTILMMCPQGKPNSPKEKLLRANTEAMLQAEEACMQGCQEYLAAMEHFCRRIGGIGVRDAMRLYLPNLDVDYGEETTGELTEAGSEVLDGFLSTWRLLMGHARG